MADRYTIQRYPIGLPGLLTMKASGDVPPSLSAEVSASIDLTEFYLAPEVLVANGNTGNLNAIGFFASPIAVPFGEMWCVRNISAAAGAAIGAGTTLKWHVAWQRRSATLTAQTGHGQTLVTGTAGEAPGVGQLFEPFRLFYQGDLFGAWCDGGTFAIPQPLSISVEYQRILI